MKRTIELGHVFSNQSLMVVLFQEYPSDSASPFVRGTKRYPVDSKSLMYGDIEQWLNTGVCPK